jgi:voltage-gated potassium channel
MSRSPDWTKPAGDGAVDGGADEPRRRAFFAARRTDQPAAPLRLSDLETSDKRRALLRFGITVVLSWTLIFGAYFVLPIGRESGFRAGVRLTVDVALVAAVFLWQIRRISRAVLPELRAIEALGIVISVFLVAFSSIYLAMSHETARTFSEKLDHVQALYFAITIFSTVGFGDITPRMDVARMVVAVQMLLDLVLIGAVVRLLFDAARNRVPDRASVGDGSES